MKCEARREDPRHSRAHGEAAKAREQQQEPEVPGGDRGSVCVPAPVTAPAVPSLRSRARRGGSKAREGRGEAVPWGVTVETPGQSRPQVLSGWAPLRAPRGLGGTCKSQSRAENCPSPPGHAAQGAQGIPGLLPCSLGPAQGSLGRAVLAIPVHAGQSPLPEPTVK